MTQLAPDTTVRVALIEDDRRTREGYAYILDSTPGFRCVGSWGSVEEALRRPTTERQTEATDVLLLDIELPGMSGTEGLPHLTKRFPGATVLMLTVFEDEQRIFEALCNGAQGYLLKNAAPGRILDAIREADSGGSPMSPEIARKVVQLFRRVAPRRDDLGLTPREVRLLALLAEGHSYQSAADEMIVSVNTVRKYIRSIYDKLHVHSKSAAVTRALRAGLI